MFRCRRSRSVRLGTFALLIGSVGVFAQHFTSTTSASHWFEDPRGRFRVLVPAGWDAAAAPGEEAAFRRGASWIHVLCLPASSAKSAVDAAVAKVQPQFLSFATINGGPTTIAGRPAYGLNVNAMTADAQHMSVLITAQPEDKGLYFVLVSATPVAEAPQLNHGVMALAGSVRFKGE